MAATITQNSKPLRPRALDTSGNNNHGTAYTGQALEFDGVNDYITMLLGLMDRATAVSISLWFKTTGADGGMIAKYASSSIYSWWITVKGGKLCANINANQSAQSDLVSTSNVNDGNWHQAVLTWSYASGLASLYLDGVLIDTDANTNEVDLRNGSLNNTIGFQGYISGGVTTQAAGWYAGFLSNVQIWDTVLTAPDVAYAYLNPEKLALDNSGTSLIYSNLKLWYPMQDGTRGQQINLMDGANTGLSDELIDISNWNDPSHDWVANGDGSFTVNENAGSAGYIAQEYIFPLSVNLYKFTYTITNSSGTGGSNQLRFAGGNSGLGTVNLDGENGTHTVYLSSNGSKWHLQIQENGFVGTISNISLKGYNLKNHGTSTFYGDELITNGDMSSGTGWALDSGWAIGSGVLTGSSVTLEATQTGILVLGRTYKVVWTIASLSGGSVKVKCGTTTGTTQTGTGTFTEYITCAGNTNFLLDGHSAFSGTIDNVSVVEVGFATGWTDADVQPIIPQLGFQSYNQLAYFNGTNTTVPIADTTNDNDNIFNSGGSISAWILAEGVGDGNFGRIVDKSASTSAASGYTFFVREESGSTCKLAFQKGHSTTDGQWKTTSEDLIYNQWNHVAVVYNASSTSNDAALYINGVESAVTEAATPAGTSEDDDSQALTIGNRSGATDRQFKGYITEVSLWTEELTLAKIQELYNDGEALDALTHSSAANLSGYWRNEGLGVFGNTWTDLSTNSNNGTPSSVTENLILPEGNNGRDTQGFLMTRERTSGLNLTQKASGGQRVSYVDIGASTISAGTDFTIGFWTKAETYNANNIMGASANDYISFSKNGNHVKINVRANANSVLEQFESPQIHSVNDTKKWHYWTITRGLDASGSAASNQLRFYIDGEPNAEADQITTHAFAHDMDLRYLGNLTTASTSFQGNLDDVVIYNATALTAAQVKRNYKAGKRRHKN